MWSNVIQKDTSTMLNKKALNQYLRVTITLVPPPNTTVIQFVYMAVQKPPDLMRTVKPHSL